MLKVKNHVKILHSALQANFEPPKSEKSRQNIFHSAMQPSFEPFYSGIITY